MVRIWTFLIFLTASAAGSARLLAADEPHFYQMESGIVEFTVTGAQTGKETLYFDQWGLRQARHTRSETPTRGVSNIVTLTLRDWTYIIDPEKNLGQKEQDQVLKDLLENAAGSDADLAASWLTRKGWEKIDEGIILERPCTVWHLKDPGIKLWIWKGIPLRIQASSEGGDIVMTAVKIEENAALPENIFIIPGTIRFINADINKILLSRRSQKPEGAVGYGG